MSQGRQSAEISKVHQTVDPGAVLLGSLEPSQAITASIGRDSIIDSKDPKRSLTAINTEIPSDETEQGAQHVYRLYKQRFVGQISLFFLCIGSAMPWPWFGPIANDVHDELGFSLDRINWLGTVTNVMLLAVSLLVPDICSKYGIRRTCEIGAFFLFVSSWIRFAGTATSLSQDASYALIMLGQILAGISQPFFLILGPKYSETWFDLKGRMTATMVLSIANPVGGAIAQLISPVPGNTRTSLFILGIINTAIAPLALLIKSAPPTPPTFSATHKPPGYLSLVRAMLGREAASKPTHMSVRERIDFGIIILIFGALVGVVTAFSVLTAQFFEPYGYDDTISGLMGAVLLLVGIVFAAITSPLFDRVLTYHMALTCKLVSPINAILWLTLIWAVKPNNVGGLFAIMALMGASSMTLLPVALELAVELTRNADGSAAILWFSGNLFGVMFILAEGALRADDSANPPNNMRRALIFQGAFVCGIVGLILLLKGEQKRRRVDERHAKDAQQQIIPALASTTASP